VVCVYRHAPVALRSGKRHGVNWRGGWVDCRTGLEGAENLAPTGIFFCRPVCSFDPVCSFESFPPSCDVCSILLSYPTNTAQASMSPAGFGPTIAASQRPQTHALNRAATGIGTIRSPDLEPVTSCYTDYAIPAR
jgi:hypothetical protein